MGGSTRVQITDEKQEMIRTVFIEDPTIFLIIAAAQVGLLHTTERNILNR